MDPFIARMHSSNKAYGSGFMMLSSNLYAIFVRYIQQGRVRAPPAIELTELSPTFQFGAKTDRRALQSKFKSWAKRMALLDGQLIMASTGKFILPREQCEPIIKQLHLQNEDQHMAFEEVVCQIQGRYTWSRKNFGMDWNIVAASIPTICNRDSCLIGLQQVYGLQRARNDISFQSNTTTSSNSFSDSNELSPYSFIQLLNPSYAPSPSTPFMSFPLKHTNPQVIAKLLTPGSYLGESPSIDSQKTEFLRNLKLVEAECNKSMKRKRPFSHSELIVPPYLIRNPANDSGSSFSKRGEKGLRLNESLESHLSPYSMSYTSSDSMRSPMTTDCTSSSLGISALDTTDNCLKSSSLAGLWSPIASNDTKGCEWTLPLQIPPWLKLLKNTSLQSGDEHTPLRCDNTIYQSTTGTTANESSSYAPYVSSYGATNSNVSTPSPLFVGKLKTESPNSSIISTAMMHTSRRPTALWRPDPQAMDSNYISIKEERISPDIATHSYAASSQTPPTITSMSHLSTNEFSAPQLVFSLEREIAGRYLAMCNNFNQENIKPPSSSPATVEVNKNFENHRSDDISENYNELGSLLESKGNLQDKLENLWTMCNQMQFEFRQFLLSLIVEDGENSSLQELHKKIDDTLRLVRETKNHTDLVFNQSIKKRCANLMKSNVCEITN